MNLIEFKIARKYIFSHSGRTFTSNIMIFLGIAFSLAALLVSVGIINSLQQNMLTHIRNVESFDVVVSNTKLINKDFEDMKNLDEFYQFSDFPALISNEVTNKTNVLRIRAIDSMYFLTNPSILWYSPFSDNIKNLSFSYSLLNDLGLNEGSDISVTFLKPGRTARLAPFKFETKVSGVFYSLLSEFNNSTVYGNIEWFKNLSPTTEFKYGIFSDSNLDKLVMEIKQKDPNATITTWKDANKAIYAALILEKTILTIFLFFLFFIIAVNLKNSTKRLLNIKKKESGMLRAIGMKNSKVKSIFIIQALLISLSGIILGIIFYFIVSKNTKTIFSFVDNVIAYFTGNTSFIGIMAIKIELENSYIFIISLLVMILSLIFSVIGASKIFKKDIMEVILNDEHS